MAIILHHLRYSRSTRILWLLEEMGLDYELVQHDRNPKTNRAQDDLAQIHPLAKAPTIIVDGKTMVESGAIIEYLIETYGAGKLAPQPGSADRAAYLEWLHFAEGTMAMPIILTLLAPRFGGLGEVLAGFLGGEVTKLLDYADTHMQGRDFVVGEGFTGADINLAYIIEVSNAGKLLESRSALTAYLERMQSRDMYRKAIEIGGPVVSRMIRDSD